MKISRAGLELIKRWEGCELKAYKDSVGVWTIGYGLTSAAGIVPVKEGMVITQQQADDYLARALGQYESAVVRAIKRPPTQAQFDAMVSLCYNIGTGAFAGSTLVRRFNAGDIAGAADAFLMWNKAGDKELKGLTNRRKDERAFFLRASPAATAPAPIPPPPDIEPPQDPDSRIVDNAPPPAANMGKGIAGGLIAALGAAFAAFFYWMTKG